MAARLGIISLCLVLFLTFDAQARTRLVTLPDRDRVIIRLIGRDAALVQESRVLSLNKGINRVDFSWQNVSIDPGSIHLDTGTGPDRVRLLSLSFPPGESALVWEIYSNASQELPVVISYLLAGIDRIVAYRATLDKAEKFMDLEGRMVLRNFSGEDFLSATAWLGPGIRFPVSARHMETRQVLFFEAAQLPVRKVYEWDGRVMPHDPEKSRHAVGIPMGYEIENSGAAGLGAMDLDRGKVRVFQADGRESTIFSGENRLRFLPRGDKAFLKIGESRDILVTKRRLSSETTRIRRNEKGVVQVYDEIIRERYTVENTKDQPVTLLLTDRIQGQWEPLDMGHAYTRKDHETLEFKVALAPGQEKTIDLTYKVLNISRALKLM